MTLAFKNLCSKYDISDFQISDEQTLIVKKWNWEYESAHQFQQSCVELIKKNKHLKVFIFCSHPSCFTHGRGLQKQAGKTIESLEEFDETLISALPYPFHKISRGGGLTFHYPQQWIFYPIVNLVNREFTLPALMNWTLETLQKTLTPYSDSPIEIKLKEKAGLWRNERKIASLGFALDRFVTYHGLAFNLNHNQEMFNSFQNLNPCGLSPKVYHYFNDDKTSLISREKLQEVFEKELKSLLRH